jgi:hypothetical protein
MALGQQAAPNPPEEGDVMVAAVSRDESVLTGGISSGKLKAAREVDVTPLAWLNPSGEWISIACDDNHLAECSRFGTAYLKKPHAYTMVSADGRGATIAVKEMRLDTECFGYGGQGTYSGASINYAGVAASSPAIFSAGRPARRLSHHDAEPIVTLLSAAVGEKLDSTKELQVYSLRLEGHDLFVVQRAFQDWVSKPDYDMGNSAGAGLKMIFAIGTRWGGQFQLLHWKENIEDENEQILGTIHLRSGRDFLVNTVSQPEGQFFRIYGIRDGKLSLVYSGGGGSC